MAHFRRAKQPAGLDVDPFEVATHSIIGIHGQIHELAFDPVQAILVVGAASNGEQPGRVYVLGEFRAQTQFEVSAGANADCVRINGPNVICFDSRHWLTVFSLEKNMVVEHVGGLSSHRFLSVDPGVDVALISNSSDLKFFDSRHMKMGNMAVSLRNDGEHKMSYMAIGISVHPRDLGTVLIAYGDGIVLFSLLQNEAVKSFKYKPGGTTIPPKMTCAVWHPTGTFVACAFESGDILFWDPRSGQTVDIPAVAAPHDNMGGRSKSSSVTQMMWCAGARDPDETTLVVVGGKAPLGAPGQIRINTLGRTPVYVTTSWDAYSKHLYCPVRSDVVPIPPLSRVMRVCPVGTVSPHFAGCHGPTAFVAALKTGEVVIFDSTDGSILNPANRLPASLLVTARGRTDVTVMRSDVWISTVEDRGPVDLFLTTAENKAGIAAVGEWSNVAHACRPDGTVHLWDVSRPTAIANGNVFTADVRQATDRPDAVATRSSLCGSQETELSVGTAHGDVVVFSCCRADRNSSAMSDAPLEVTGLVTDISARAPKNLLFGFLPQMLYRASHGPVTALNHSELGFVAAGFQDGSIVVIERKTQRVIFDGLLPGPVQPSRKIGALFGRSHAKAQDSTLTSPTPVTGLYFSIMTADRDTFSSILLHANDQTGLVASFKILPTREGSHEMHPIGTAPVSDNVVHMTGINIKNGTIADASLDTVTGLSRGVKTDGVVVIVTTTAIKSVLPGQTKVQHHVQFKDRSCVSASTISDGHVSALACVFSDGSVTLYSLFGIKEIKSDRISGRTGVPFDPRPGENPVVAVLRSGDVYFWSGPTEMVGIQLLRQTSAIHPARYNLYKSEKTVPPRPQMSTMEWLGGRQQLDERSFYTLVFNPESMNLSLFGIGAGSDTLDQSTNSMADAKKSLVEKGTFLNALSDTFDNLTVSTGQMLQDVQKDVKKTKNKALLGGAMSLFR